MRPNPMRSLNALLAMQVAAPDFALRTLAAHPFFLKNVVSPCACAGLKSDAQKRKAQRIVNVCRDMPAPG